MRTLTTFRVSLLFTLACVLGLTGGAAGQTRLVSSGVGGAPANEASDFSSISADGRFIVFHSDASNLVSSDSNGVRDVFLLDRITNETIRVSTDAAGVQGNGASANPVISSNGRFVAYQSVATNLVAGDSNGFEDVFVFDRLTGLTELISVDESGQSSNGDSTRPSISNNGFVVAFLSAATDLVPGDTNGFDDVFVRDRGLGTTVRVSVDLNGVQSDGPSFFPVISGGGSTVVFSSNATNLVTNDTNGTRDVFWHTLGDGITARVSVSDDDLEGNGFSGRPVVSDDGLVVAFESNATNLVASDTNGVRDTFVRELLSGSTTRVSVDSAGNESNGTSQFKAITGDGRFVAIVTEASNLVPGDTNGVIDVVRHDRVTGETIPISVDSAGVLGNGDSIGPSMSADGRWISFRSGSTNLVSGDTNGANDIFLHDVAAAEGSTGPVVFVDSMATGDNDGTSWANAYTSLQDGLNDANALFFGANVWVRQGTYMPTTGDDQTATFGLLEQPATPISVLGGFFGNEVAPGDRNPFVNFTLLSGDIGVVDDVSDNSFSVITLVDRSDITFDGLNIIRGNANGTVVPLSRFGGGIFISGSSGGLLFERCLFDGNNANADESGGGAVAIVDAETTGTAATFTRCVFTGNSAVSPNSALGGAVYIGSVDGTGSGEAITDFNLCDFSANQTNSTTLAGGGAVAINEGDVGFFNSLFFLNGCDAPAEFGGAINLQSSAAPIALLEVVNCTITQNTAASGAGVSSIGAQTDAQLTNSIVWNNNIGTALGSTAGGNITASHTIFEESDGSSSNLALDPDFIDPLFLNFRLDPMTSVAIDSGDNLASFGGTDLDANNRVINGTIDRGAFETPVGADATPPVVAAFARFNSAPQSTMATTLLWELTFEEPVNIPPMEAFTIENDPGVIGPFELTIADADDTGRSYIAVLDLGGGSGDVSLSLNAPDVSTVYNVAGSGQVPSEPYTLMSGVDTTPPSVVSIVSQDSGPVGGGATQTSWLVEFSEPVTGVDTTVFIATETANESDVAPAIESVVDQGGGDTYLITYNIGEGEFDFRCDLDDGKSQIQDLAGNLLDSNTFTSGDEVTIDTIAPTVVSILSLSSSPANGPVQYGVTFSEDVLPPVNADFDVLLVAGTLGGASVTDVFGGNADWTIEVTPGAGTEGVLNLGIAAGNTIADLAGNELGAAGETGEVIDVDVVAPQVSLVVDLFEEGPYEVGDTVTFDVVFDSQVQEVTAMEFDAVAVSGDVSANVLSATGSTRGGANASWLVDVQITGSTGGTLRLDVLPGTISDPAGNVLPAIFTSGEVVTVNAAPLPSSYPFSDALEIGSSVSGIGSLAAGDLNGDGLLDAAFTAPSSGTIGWLDNTGGSPPVFVQRTVGSAAAPRDLTGEARGTPPANGIAIGDMNGDGRPEVVALADDSVIVFRNNGDSPLTFTEIGRLGAPNASGLDLADFNGDGLLDIVAALLFSDPLVFINDSAQPGQNFTLNTPLAAVEGGQVRAADMDLDGDMDFVINDSVSDGVIVAINNNGLGTAWTGLTRGIGNGGGGISLADADRDGDLDVFATSNDDIVYLENRFREQGSLATAQTVGGFGKSSPIDDLPVGDFDFDGDLDVVEFDGLDLGLLLNDAGSPPLFNSVASVFLSDSLSRLIAGDFDNDGDLDLVGGSDFSFDSPLAYIDNISVARVVGLAQENQFTVTNAQRGPTDAALADIDHDGDLDVVVCSIFDDTLAWYENDGSDQPGAFAQRIIADFATPTTRPDGPIKLDVGDIDGDGDLDIVVASLVDGAIHLYESAVADTGAANFAHVLSAQTVSTPGAVAIGDIDRDGSAEIVFGDGEELWAVDVEVMLPDEERGGFSGTNFAFTPALLASGAANGNADIRDLQVMDINGDGQMDIVSGANSFANGTSHVLGRALTGAFPPAIGSAIGFTSSGSSLEVLGIGVEGGDFDGDGDIDIAHSTIGANIEFQGTTPSIFPIDLSADSIRDVKGADIDLDGDLDLVVAASRDNTVAWLANEFPGMSTFGTNAISSLTQNVQEVEVGDVTRTGFPDIVSVSFGSDAVTLHRNSGGQALVTPSTFPNAVPMGTAQLVLQLRIDHPGGEAGLLLEQLAIGLDNGIGIGIEGQPVDLSLSLDAFEVYRDAGSPGFDESEDIFLGDIAIPSGAVTGISIGLEMTASEPRTIRPMESGVFFLVARINANPLTAIFRASLAGAPSVVLSDASQIVPIRAARFDRVTTPLISVGANGSKPTPGDADGDGLTTTADLTFVVSNLGAGTSGAVGTPGDVNGDGQTTVADITTVVSNLGAGPGVSP